MVHHFIRSSVFRVASVFVITVAAATAPTPALAKELASEAIAAAVGNGTFDQVRMALIMDMNARQRFEFDENGIEAVGRRLLGQGRYEDATGVLQLNQMINSNSSAAANALADAFGESGNPMAARMYYQRALEIDPADAHARKMLKDPDGEGEQVASERLRQAGVDPQALAAAGVTPEQMRQMEEAMSQAQKMAAGGGIAEASTRPVQTGSSAKVATQPTPIVAHESEFCEVLHRFNAEKKISDQETRGRVEGEYGEESDVGGRRTWNVETTCGEFLVAVPLWADVSPPVLSKTGADRFTDATGGTWEFQVGADGVATDVTMVAADATVTKMKRLGDPRRFD